MVKQNTIAKIKESKLSSLKPEELDDYKERLYAQNAERVKVELNNLVWMNSAGDITLDDAEAITGTMLEMVFYPQRYLQPDLTPPVESR